MIPCEEYTPIVEDITVTSAELTNGKTLSAGLYAFSGRYATNGTLTVTLTHGASAEESMGTRATKGASYFTVPLEFMALEGDVFKATCNTSYYGNRLIKIC